MKILLFGRYGMLGNYVYHKLSQYYDIIFFTRKEYDIESNDYEKLNFLIKNIDVIINCAGIIPHKSTNIKENISVNALFPQLLNCICIQQNIKFIHITTDCVFSGDRGNYKEDDIHDSTYIYGITKSTGEPKGACIIRTSIIGEEIKSKVSLLEWTKSQNKIYGYTNHYWNGITCFQLSEIIFEIIEKNMYWKGVRHIYGEKVSKYNLIKKIIKIYNLNVELIPIEKNFNDKSLDSNYINNYKILNLEEQLELQKNLNIFFQ